MAQGPDDPLQRQHPLRRQVLQPLRWGRFESPASEGWQVAAIVAEIESPCVPAPVGGRKPRRDVRRPPVRPQLKRIAAGAHRQSLPLIPRRGHLREEDGLKEVDPEIPMDLDSEMPFTKGNKDGRLHDGIWR